MKSGRILRQMQFNRRNTVETAGLNDSKHKGKASLSPNQGLVCIPCFKHNRLYLIEINTCINKFRNISLTLLYISRGTTKSKGAYNICHKIIYYDTFGALFLPPQAQPQDNCITRMFSLFLLAALL